MKTVRNIYLTDVMAPTSNWFLLISSAVSLSPHEENETCSANKIRQYNGNMSDIKQAYNVGLCAFDLNVFLVNGWNEFSAVFVVRALL